MTTMPAYGRYPEVVARLERARGRWRAVATGEGLAGFVALVAGTLLSATLLAGFLRLPQWIRGLLFFAMLAVWAVGLVRFAVWPLFTDPTPAQVARHIETALPDLENGLINAVQLSADRRVPAPRLVDRAISEIAASLEGRDLARAIDRRRLTRLGVIGAALLILLGAYAAGWPGRFSGAVHRLWHYSAFVPFVGRVRILNVEPKDATVVLGESVTVRVSIDNPATRLYDATVYLKPEGAAVEEAVAMIAESPDTFFHTIEDVRTPLAYRVKVGDSESRVFNVAVVGKPIVSGVDVVYHYPLYTGLPPRAAPGGNISAVRYTFVDLTIRVNKPVAEGALVLEGRRERPLALGAEGRLLTARHVIDRNETYRIRVTDHAGYTNEDATTYSVTALDDQKPTIEIRHPGRDVEVLPGGRLSLLIQAADDFGLSAVTLWAQPDGLGTPQVVRQWTDLDGARQAPLAFDWRFPAERFKAGDTLLYYAEATDARQVTAGADELTPQTSRSGSYLVKFLDRAAAQEERVNALEAIRRRLAEVLSRQREARAAADDLAPDSAREVLAARARDVLARQVDIRERTLGVAADCRPDDPHQGRIRLVLVGLAHNQQAQAVKAAGDAAQAPDAAAAGPVLEDLRTAQDAVIRVLEELLGMLPQMRESILAEREPSDGHDLPPYAAQKLRDLLDKLHQFVGEQKKVVEATEDLAKTPVDDFSEDDERKLKALEAVEDKWAKFLKEAHADLSKLPPQDFADATLLKELLEIQSDVEMAKDALAKKAVELAVPLEQAGVEAAQELTTHLEKWLPDTPDRDQWKMEEPLAGSDNEQMPMAQLPKELEDLVGALMEQEEDLFEDIEDVTSQHADSLDKGAGWDAMDGPISNMSAQGVTGNRLPNTSEIGGRSGEGRSGKAAGEFVEEEATGKGGRRTPTRLTPDAFSKGEIKDTSKEPPGGSTGGGKLSGAAPQGLEGPVPPQLSREMERLAGRQAELRNQAERLNLQFQVLNYGASPMPQVIRQMEGVERDLRDHRYQSALRRREVLVRDLKTTRMYLAGEMAVRRDPSVNLPNELQRHLRDALSGEIPAGYADLLGKYYEALARGAHESRR